MYQAGIIGLGRIAAMYANPHTEHPYCHAGGIRQSDNVRLAAGADLFSEARNSFMDVWGSVFPDIRIYESAEKLMNSERLDIVAICTRGPLHFETLLQVLEHRPKHIFLEKPPTCSLEEMDRILEMADASKVAVTVSYSRHWNPHIMRMQELARDGLVGEIHTVIGYCGGRVLSYASHTTDLICQFAGYDPVVVAAEGIVAGEAPDGYEPEPTLNRMDIDFAGGIRGIQIGHGGEHGEFYCEVFGSEGSFTVGTNAPTLLRNRKGQPLDLTDEKLQVRSSVFKVAYNQIAEYLSGGSLPHCTGREAAAVHEIGFAAIESMHTGSRVFVPNVNRTRLVFANH